MARGSFCAKETLCQLSPSAHVLSGRNRTLPAVGLFVKETCLLFVANTTTKRIWLGTKTNHTNRTERTQKQLKIKTKTENPNQTPHKQTK